jgi:outer membrane biosynthesis protein TonB
MTRTIAAILALAPGMLLAQAKTPAQPSSTPVLQSALLQPVAFAATKSSDNATSSTPVRISTGVIAPKLVHRVTLAPTASRNYVLSADTTVVVKMVVDETGKPTNLHLVGNSDPFIAREVLDAVNQFRYQPGTLDGQPTAVPVKLEYTLQAGAAY